MEAAGAASLSELTYGIDISPDGARLFFGNAGEQGFFSTTAEIYSIDLNQDGSFVGTVNNSSMPTGATWDNYVGNETEHFEVTIELFSIYPEQLAISDMEFTPDGKLLVGCRAFCSNNIHSSYNHGGRAILLSPNNNGLYSINEGIIYTGFQLSLGNSRESYGGVSTFEEDGKILYAISSADMLIEEGPHGISLSEAGDFGSQGSPVSPAGIISYGSNPFTLDPKGIGGDIKFFVPCMEEQEESCSLESIDAGNDLDVCAPGQTVTLNGTVTGAFNTVEWTPSEGLSDPNSLTPMVDVSATTTYTLKAFGVGTTQNLIVNGDFTFGLTGFTSAYELGTGGPFGPLSEEGTYAVTTNTNFVHSNWASCTDHTTGTGNMLAVNAATMPDENIWCQTVAVTPDTDYEFSTWITSAIAENPPILQFSINDTLLGNPFSVPPTPCQWNQFFETWTSTIETSVEICITNQNTSQSGNDFAIDDISFGPVCTLEDEVTITVLEPIVAVADSIANIPCDNGGTGIVLDGTGSSIGADIEYLWSTDDGNIISGANTLMPLVNTAGTYTLTVLQLSSFDSCMVSAEVIVTQDTTTLSLPETVEICQGDSYTFDVTGFDTYEWSPADFLSCTDCPNPTATPPTTITYTLMASSTNGCTGSGSTEIIVLPFLETMLEFEACAGDSADYNGTLLAPGSVTDFTFTAQSGCDSIVTVTVIELPTFSASLTLEACAGDSVDYNGTLLAPGSVTDFNFIAQNGCDSIVTVTVNELPEFSSSLTLEACAGDSVDYNGTLLAPGSTTDFSFIAQNGCDSIVTVTVNELPEFSSSLTLEACAGDSADYNGTLLAPGSTTDFSFIAQNGCDSVVTVTVNELPTFSSSLTLEACAGDSTDYNGTPLAPGTVTDFTFTAQNGCDSVVTVTVNELPTFSSSLTLEACAGDAADYNGTPLAPGTVTDFTFTAQNGCDSVVTVTVNELLPSETFETLTICPEDSVEIFGMLVNATGDYTMVFTAANGCDSTHTITLNWFESPTITAVDINDLSCFEGMDGAASVSVADGMPQYMFLWSNGSTEAFIDNQAAGDYSVTVTDANGCSTSTNLTIGQPTELVVNTTVQDVGCDEPGSATASAMGGTPPYSYVWSNGADTSVILDILAGIYTVTVTDANACTQTAEIELTGAFGPELSIQIDAMPDASNPSNGALSAIISAGTPPFTFLWNTGDTSSVVTGLPTGEYSLTITDSNGCTAEANTFIFLPGCISGTIWEDENRDDCRSAGDSGLSGFELNLTGTDIFGNAINATTTTNYIGDYTFDMLPPGDYQIQLVTGTDLILVTPNNCSSDNDDSDFDEVSMVVNYTLADGECPTNIDGGLFNPCLNVQHPGSICCDQIICGPGNIPNPILSQSPATGTSEPIEYMWMQGVPSGPSGSIIFLGIPNSNSPDYAPGPLFETTYFRRCVRAVGCKKWLETGIVTIEVDTEAVAEITAPINVCVGDVATFEALDNGPGATYNWDFGPLATPSQATGTSVDVSWSQQGYITVNLTVTNQGCTSHDSRGIVVFNNPMFCGNMLKGNHPETGGNTFLQHEFDVFPNPARDELHIRWNKAVEGTIVLTYYALDGVEVLRTMSAGDALTHRMAIADLPSGMYILNIQLQSGESFNVKTIKQ